MGRKGRREKKRGRQMNEGPMRKKETAPFLHHNLVCVLNTRGTAVFISHPVTIYVV